MASRVKRGHAGEYKGRILRLFLVRLLRSASSEVGTPALFDLVELGLGTHAGWALCQPWAEAGRDATAEPGRPNPDPNPHPDPNPNRGEAIVEAGRELQRPQLVLAGKGPDPTNPNYIL